MTSSAPTRSSSVSEGAASVALALAAARNAASRASAAKSPATKPGVRAAMWSRSSAPSVGTPVRITPSIRARRAASGSPMTSSRSHRSGARRRSSSPAGSALVTINAMWSSDVDVASVGLIAARSSSRINVETGSDFAGSRASTSVISSTPEPERRRSAIASLTARRRAEASSDPMVGPSIVVNVLAAQTDRTSVAFPDPAGPESSTPSRGVAPSARSTPGSSSVMLSHSVSFATCASTPTNSDAGRTTCPGDSAPGGVVSQPRPTPPAAAPTAPRLSPTTPGLVSAARGAAPTAPRVASTPSDAHSTAVEGCTLTGDPGSVAVTVSNSLVHVMPTDNVSARVAALAVSSGPRSRGSSDTASPTDSTLPRSARRSVASSTPRLATAEPVTTTRAAPCTATPESTTEAFSLMPALENVMSSSSSVPVGVPDGAAATTAAVTRAPVIDTASHSRNPSAVSASG